MSVHPAPAINTQRGGSGAGDGSIGALPIPYIPSWLRAHRWWQLLMGAGCPRGMSGSGEGCDGGREVAPQRRFPELDPDVPLRRDGDAAFGVTINKGWKRPMKRGFSVAKVAKCPFLSPSLCPPSIGGVPAQVCGLQCGITVFQVIHYGINSSTMRVPGDLHPCPS